jgi:uncharacterized protein (AIM24 family)
LFERKSFGNIHMAIDHGSYERLLQYRIPEIELGKGALIVTERKVYAKKTGDLVYTLEQTSFCRGDGGFWRAYGTCACAARDARNGAATGLL